MNKKQIIGAVVAAVLFIAVGVTSVFTNTIADSFLKRTSSEVLSGGTELQLPNREYVGVVNVVGTIQEQTTSDGIFDTSEGYQHLDTLEYIDRMKEDSSNKGILLRVDSPGGAVYESEELYLKLKEYQKELLEYIGNLYPEIIRKLSEQKVLTEELEDKIVKAAEEFRDKSRC